MTTQPMINEAAVASARENLRIEVDADELARRALEAQLSGVEGRQPGEGVPQGLGVSWGERTGSQLTVRVYDWTGEPRDVPIWATQGRNSIMRRRLAPTPDRPNGVPMFSIDPPEGSTWTRGQVMCLLHPRHPNREKLPVMGLEGKLCDLMGAKHAGNLASPYAMRLHMQHKHRNEWAVIQEYETEQRALHYEQQAQAQIDATLKQSDAMMALVQHLIGMGPGATLPNIAVTLPDVEPAPDAFVEAVQADEALQAMKSEPEDEPSPVYVQGAVPDEVPPAPQSQLPPTRGKGKTDGS